MRSCQWKRHFDLFWLPLLFRLPTCFCCPTSPYKNQPTQTKWTKNKEEKQRQIKASVYNWRHGGNQEHCIENLAEHKSGISAAYNMNFKLGTEHCKYRINKTRNFPHLDQNLCGSEKWVSMCVCRKTLDLSKVWTQAEDANFHFLLYQFGSGKDKTQSLMYSVGNKIVLPCALIWVKVFFLGNCLSRCLIF